MTSQKCAIESLEDIRASRSASRARRLTSSSSSSLGAAGDNTSSKIAQNLSDLRVGCAHLRVIAQRAQ